MRAIDGDALIEKLGIAKDCNDCEHNEEPYCRWKPDVVDICEAIDDAPTIEPERKKGKWIPHREKSREYIGTTLIHVTYDYWLCDTCGYRVENGRSMYNFCPNCGADMRGAGWKKYISE